MPGMPSSEPRFVSSSHHGVARSDEPPRHAGFCRSAPWARPLSPNDVLLSPAVAPKRRSYRGHSSSRRNRRRRSEEHTSELQSLMRNSYAVFCLKKTKNKKTVNTKERQSRHNNRKKR